MRERARERERDRTILLGMNIDIARAIRAIRRAKGGKSAALKRRACSAPLLLENERVTKSNVECFMFKYLDETHATSNVEQNINIV